MITMGQAWKNYWKQYVGFKGQATRAEYWWMQLISGLITIVIFILLLATGASIIIGLFGGDKPHVGSIVPFIIVAVLAGLWGLANVLPTFALIARRWQDAGFKIWHWLVLGVLVPIILSAISNVLTTNGNHGGLSSFVTFLTVIVGIFSFVVSVLPTKVNNN
ncbi:DUF805 domain-containing protein [Periweissella cryptocerci]|uniref:DUF805 domain-containing protein n=1 Tax=Periweissella cryptocerci TaxID=2506420 RepID=A0A4P6YS68_9LACO|nr:DUF805 domain-containing protein [Periweissella cryptocerci]QBO35528.1 DUF805 domain-containing protein [Periweissella cryptocerci]